MSHLGHLKPSFARFLLVSAVLCPARAATVEAQVHPRATAGVAASPTVRIDPETAPRPTLRAFPTRNQITVDGRLDEAAWRLADSTTGFILNLPRVGYPEPERTVVRILYDERYLYIGATMYDSEPELITVPGLEQDFATHNSDLFGIALDTYWDKQNAYLFAVNPAGAIFDAQVFNNSRYTNRAWEGVLYAKTRVHEWGWTAEFAIPFTTLRFNLTDGEQTWGMNFLRRVRRRNEDAYWAPLARQYRVHRMSRAGTLTGLRRLRPGMNLTIKPYISLARQVGELRVDDRGNDLDGGFDLKYGVTPRLTLDATALTDFSQVEVDQEQVNLTRFSLFFPEKRDFFMENEGIFALGDVTERNYRVGSSLREFTLFHSRRIGLSEDRRPLPIAGGARLTGRLGGFEIGVLDMQTRRSGLAPDENFAVARVRRSILGNSDVGVMFVNRQGTSDGATDSYNRSFGVDANIKLLRHMIVNSYLAATDEPDVTGDRTAARVQVAWRDPVWNVSGLLKHVGDAFNPGVGFVRRRAMRQLFATVGAHPQPNIPHILEINPYADLNLVSDLNWLLETRSATGGLRLTFLDGGVLNFQYSDQFERLTEPTTIAGTQVDPGDYSFREASVSYRSSGARWISGNLRASRGGFFDGDRTSLAASVVVRPNYHLSLDFSAQHNDLTLAETSFTADVFGGRLRYAYSTQLFLSAFVQYNTSADELVTNVRLNFLHAPLSDVFLVYTERRNVDDGILLDRVITAKVTKLLTF